MRLFLRHESPLTDERTSNNSCVANVFTGVCVLFCIDLEFFKCIQTKISFDFLFQVCSLVRRFDQPQKYKPFISKCTMYGDLNIGSVRHVNVKARLPATTSTESVELLDDNEHILGIKIIGGDHSLMVYDQNQILNLLISIFIFLFSETFAELFLNSDYSSRDNRRKIRNISD